MNRYRIALVGSLALHLGFGAAFVVSLRPRPTASSKRPRPVQVSIVRVGPSEETLSTPRANPNAVRKVEKRGADLPRSTEAVDVTHSTSPAASQQKEPVTAPATSPAASRSAALESGSVPGAPRAAALVPGVNVMTHPESPVTAERPRGSLLVNDGKGPSAGELVARQAEAAARGEARVRTWIEDDLAELRVANGIVDASYRALGDEMEKQLALVKLSGNLRKWTTLAAQSYLGSLARFGATGVPYDVEPGTGFGTFSAFSPLSRALAQGQASEGHAKHGDRAEDAQLRRMQSSQLLEIGQGKLSSVLLAQVEVRQAADGTLLSTALVLSSGNPEFDQRALSVIPSAAANTTLTAPGTTRERRSLWAFEGRVHFMKKLKELRRPQDIAYLAAMSFLVLSGSFDETGQRDVEIPDFRDPRLKTTCRLLRVY